MKLCFHRRESEMCMGGLDRVVEKIRRQAEKERCV